MKNIGEDWRVKGGGSAVYSCRVEDSRHAEQSPSQGKPSERDDGDGGGR